MPRPLLVAIVGAGACAAEAPPQNARAPLPPHAAAAIALVGHEVGLAIERVTVTWLEGRCIESDDVPAELCASGLAYPDGRIYLLRRWSISSSSLVHEAMHLALYDATGNLDLDHRAPDWAVVEEIRRTLWAWECPLLFDAARCPSGTSGPTEPVAMLPSCARLW